MVIKQLAGMKDRHIDWPVFDENNDAILSFFEKWVSVANQNQLWEFDVIRALPRGLPDHLVREYNKRMIDAPKIRLSDMFEFLAEKHNTKWRKAVALEQLVNLKQHNLSVQEYADKVKKFVLIAYSDEPASTRSRLCSNSFLAGLNSKYKKPVLREEPRDFEEAVEFAKGEEIMEAELSVRFNQPCLTANQEIHSICHARENLQQRPSSVYSRCYRNQNCRESTPWPQDGFYEECDSVQSCGYPPTLQPLSRQYRNALHSPREEGRIAKDLLQTSPMPKTLSSQCGIGVRQSWHEQSRIAPSAPLWPPSPQPTTCERCEVRKQHFKFRSIEMMNDSMPPPPPEAYQRPVNNLCCCHPFSDITQQVPDLECRRSLKKSVDLQDYDERCLPRPPVSTNANYDLQHRFSDSLESLQKDVGESVKREALQSTHAEEDLRSRLVDSVESKTKSRIYPRLPMNLLLICFLFINPLAGLGAAETVYDCSRIKGGRFMSMPKFSNCLLPAVKKTFRVDAELLTLNRTYSEIPAFRCSIETYLHVHSNVFWITSHSSSTLQSVEAADETTCRVAMSERIFGKQPIAPSSIDGVYRSLWQERKSSEVPGSVFASKNWTSQRFVLEKGSVTTLGTDAIFSDLIRNPGTCYIQDGQCVSQSTRVMWNPPPPRRCVFHALGKHQVLVSDNTVLVESLQMALIILPSVKTPNHKCFPTPVYETTTDIIVKFVESENVKLMRDGWAEKETYGASTTKAADSTDDEIKQSTTNNRRSEEKEPKKEVPSDSSDSLTTTPPVAVGVAGSREQIQYLADTYDYQEMLRRNMTSAGNSQRQQFSHHLLAYDMQRNFEHLYHHLCLVTNQQLWTLKTFLSVNATAGTRAMLQRNDVTAIFATDSLIMVGFCEKVVVKQVHLDHNFNGTCYTMLPITDTKNEVWFNKRGSRDVVKTSSTAPCSDGYGSIWQYENGTVVSWNGTVLSTVMHSLYPGTPTLMKEPHFGIGDIYDPVKGSSFHYQLALSLGSSIWTLNQQRAQMLLAAESRGWTGMDMSAVNISRLAEQTGEGFAATAEKVKEIASTAFETVFGFLDKYYIAIVTIVGIALGVIAIFFIYYYCGNCCAATKAATIHNVQMMETTTEEQDADKKFREETMGDNVKRPPYIVYVAAVPEVFGIKRNLPYCLAHVKDRAVPMLLDSGSAVSYMRKSTAKELGPISKWHGKARTANGSPFSFIGKCTMNLRLAEHTSKMTFLVSNDENCPAPALLGYDFFSQLSHEAVNVILSPARGSVLIGSKETALANKPDDLYKICNGQRKEGKVWTTEEVVLAPFELRRVGIETKSMDSKLLYKLTPRHQKLQFGEQLLHSSAASTSLMISNSTNKTILVPKSTLIHHQVVEPIVAHELSLKPMRSRSDAKKISRNTSKRIFGDK